MNTLLVIPKPNATLCDLLDLKMDYELGFCSVGKITEGEVRFLHEGSSSHPFFGDHCHKVGFEDKFHPSPTSERNAYFFDFAEVDSRDTFDLITPSLKTLLPNLACIPNLRFTYLKCDFLALHDDLAMKGHDYPHSMAILLSAPYGCKLVTNGALEADLRPGDVVVINDQVRHGAYPQAKPESTAEEHLETLKLATQEEDFIERNCMSFLLICAVNNQ